MYSILSSSLDTVIQDHPLKSLRVSTKLIQAPILIRFDNVKYYSNGVDFYYDMYKDPYKSNYTDKEFQAGNEMYEPDYVSTKHISMPVWGVAYGDKQDAFVAYVTKGSEYFGLVYRGRNEDNEYASIRPRFERNRKYSYRFGTGLASTMVLLEDEIYIK